MKLTQVVAAVLYNSDGEYLLSSRPEGKAYAGYWEFAGGKIEAGETAFAALKRELDEELGIGIQAANLWLTLEHEYEHAHVRLQFFRIAADAWTGELTAKEAQSWAWQNPLHNNVSPMLPANLPIIQALSIPTTLTGSLKTGLVDDNQRLIWHPNRSNALNVAWATASVNDLPNQQKMQQQDAWLLLVNEGTQLECIGQWLMLGVSRPIVLALSQSLLNEVQAAIALLLTQGLHGVAILDDQDNETIDP